MQDEQNADSNENNNTGSQNVRHRTEGQENKENADLADEEDVPSSESKLKLTLVSLDIMQYIFYLPVYFTGPLFTFQDFNIQVRKFQRVCLGERVCVSGNVLKNF